jgi:hypothetical protein
VGTSQHAHECQLSGGPAGLRLTIGLSGLHLWMMMVVPIDIVMMVVKMIDLMMFDHLISRQCWHCHQTHKNCRAQSNSGFQEHRSLLRICVAPGRDRSR